MKNKKIFSGLIICLMFLGIFLMTSNVGATEIEFTPNVRIPGSMFNTTKVIQIKSHQNLLGEYIKALYNYGAILAGAVAMFMLVFAGWRWLMAAGSAEKIANAKDTINGVLIGLILLFGGYILLSQISTGLVNFDKLALQPFKTIASDEAFCLEVNQHHYRSDCGTVLLATTSPAVGYKMACIDVICDNPGEVCVDEKGKECSAVSIEGNKIFEGESSKCTCEQLDCSKLSLTNLNGGFCTNIPTEMLCNSNACFGERDSNDRIMDKVCYWAPNEGIDGLCKNLDHKTCGDSDDCNQYGEASQEWCCNNVPHDTDYCAPKSQQGVNCKP